MIDLTPLDLPTTARQLALAMAPELDALRRECHRAVPDGERVYPGIVALLVLQGVVWPLWAAAAGEAMASATDADAEPEDALVYVPVSSEAPGHWRFTYRAINERVAWALVGGSGLSATAAAERVLDHADVADTLGTLNAEGKVVATNLAPNLLLPLLGRRLSGEERLDWPFCECSSLLSLLPIVAEAVPELRPILAATAERFAGWYRELPSDAARPAVHTAVQLTYTTMAGQLWRELFPIQAVSASARRSGLAGLLAHRRQQPPLGILLLHGDHWRLWRSVRELASAGMTPE